MRNVEPWIRDFCNWVVKTLIKKHVESWGKPRNSKMVLEAMPGKDIHLHVVFSTYSETIKIRPPYTFIHLFKTNNDTGINLSKLVRGDRDSRTNLMPIYGDLYQIKL